MYEIETFKQEHIEDAVKLFISSYIEEREQSSLLPTRVVNEPDCIIQKLTSSLDKPGVALVNGNTLAGFMCTMSFFEFKRQNAAIVSEFAHASINEDKTELYQLMYMALAQKWITQNISLHLIVHFAHDNILNNTLFQLGFGAVVVEQLRDLSFLGAVQDYDIVQEQDTSRLIEIDIEHRNYYKDSPIFLRKAANRKAAAEGLERHVKKGDVIFVYNESKEPGAFFTVGSLTESAEGFLLRSTNTAQIKAAFAKNHLRNRGIGKALLQKSVEWAADNNFERLFVEHETANYYGGKFWSHFFTPYVYASMRYIDSYS